LVLSYVATHPNWSYVSIWAVSVLAAPENVLVKLSPCKKSEAITKDQSDRVSHQLTISSTLFTTETGEVWPVYIKSH